MSWCRGRMPTPRANRAAITGWRPIPTATTSPGSRVTKAIRDTNAYQGYQGYYYDNNGRYVPAPPAPVRPQQQYYGQSGTTAPAAPQRDPYGRVYQTPQPQRIEPPGYIWGNRRF